MAGPSAAAANPAAGRQDGGRGPLRASIACPACGSASIDIIRTRPDLHCSGCGLEFPVFSCGNLQVPWLFSEPTTTRLEWKARYHGLLHENSLELERLRLARDEGVCSATGRKRIGSLLHAREQHRHQVTGLLAPLELDQMQWPADAARLLSGKLPQVHGLSSYTDNVFRDWAWDNGENEALLDCLEGVLDDSTRKGLGSILTLGAGACRLSYDVHRKYSPQRSVVVDLNPLLLYVAGQVIQGNDVRLTEFPVAPLSASAYAIEQELSAPAALLEDNFHLLLADATNPPFKSGSFDTVITPWLLDVIPQDLRVFMPQINRCLDDGGLWVNTGSLAFFHRDECWRYSEEEVLELLDVAGFELVTAERRRMPYLQSPHSGYGRVENVFSFTARKVRDTEAPATGPYLPEWILDTSQPVPAWNEAAVTSSHHLLKAQVLANIDGKRTIRQIARNLARQYGLGKSETVFAVQRMLTEVWEGLASRRNGGEL